MVFNATFNNISVISWRLVLLVDETGFSGESHLGVSTYNTEGLTVGQSGLCVWRGPHSLHISDLFCKYQKRVGPLQPLQKSIFFNPINLYILFKWQSKIVVRLPHFYIQSNL